MTDDLDDLRRRNAEMLAREATKRNRKNLSQPDGERKFAEVAETPRRCATEFWNG